MRYSKNTVRDSLAYFSNGAGLREPMVSVISANQSLAPHVQILAAACALMVMCEGVDYDAHQVLSQINRAKDDMDTPFSHQWKAMLEYAKGELL